MDSLRSISTLSLICSAIFLVGVHGIQFKVGGKDGWTTSPSESYDHWSSRNRFQVNDTLYFEYVKGGDSVLVVKKEDYYACNNCHPVQKMEEGGSVFKFDNSGPFFFISGNQSRCVKGEKLLVVVLAVRHSKSHPPPPLRPSPASSPSPMPAGKSGGAVPGEVPPTAREGGKVPTSLSPFSPTPAPGPSQTKNGGMVRSAPEGWRTLVGLLGVLLVINALQSSSG